MESVANGFGDNGSSLSVWNFYVIKKKFLQLTKYFISAYNMFNKRAASQCTPDRRQNSFLKNSALLYQSEGTIFYV